jgi:hypothetical protein
MSAEVAQTGAPNKNNLAVAAECVLAGVESLRTAMRKGDVVSKKHSHRLLFTGADRHLVEETDASGEQFEAVSDTVGDLVTEVVYNNELTGEDAAQKAETRAKNLLAVAN